MITEKDGYSDIDVKVAPRSGKCSAEMDGDVLKLKIKSPPVDGKANAEVAATVAELFHISKSSVEIIRGQTSKQKTVRVYGVTKASILEAVNATR